MKMIRLSPEEQKLCARRTNDLTAQLTMAMLDFATANVEGLSHPGVIVDIVVRAAINAAAGTFQSAANDGLTIFDPAALHLLVDKACATPMRMVELDAAGKTTLVRPGGLN